MVPSDWIEWDMNIPSSSSWPSVTSNIIMYRILTVHASNSRKRIIKVYLKTIAADTFYIYVDVRVNKSSPSTNQVDWARKIYNWDNDILMDHIVDALKLDLQDLNFVN